MNQPSTTARQVHLVTRPDGRPAPDDFRLADVELPPPADGEVLVRNTCLSVDPYMRGRMSDAPSYVPPYPLDAPLEGGAVGVVEASQSADVPVGAEVQHMAGWRTHAVLPAGQVRVLDTSVVPARTYLGVLGMPGLTAWVGLTRIADLREGDAVLVTGAAGAVGSLVVQLARRLGATRVVGSAGTAEKRAWLTDELGADATVDYKAGDLAGQLAPHAPFDVCFDNVGGDQLEAAVATMAEHGRAALCGAISGYDDAEPAPGPRNLMQLVKKRLTLRGFIVTDHADATAEFHRTVAPWVADGSVRHRETVVEGIDHAVEAFLGLGTGANVGKMLVTP